MARQCLVSDVLEVTNPARLNRQHPFLFLSLLGGAHDLTGGIFEAQVVEAQKSGVFLGTLWLGLKRHERHEPARVLEVIVNTVIRAEVGENSDESIAR